MSAPTTPTRKSHPLFGQLRTNGRALREHADALVAEHGECAVLMADSEIISVYDDHATAVQAGRDQFGSGHFSVHTLPARVVYSGVITTGSAPSECG